MFISIEGVIGVGKTTVTRLVAEALQGETLFEVVEENPFLKDFYSDKEAWALQTECFFLLTRVKQLEDTARKLREGNTVISDYHVVKNRIFAELTLQGSKREKYMRTFDILTADLVEPDLVIYLTASHSVLMDRIRKRDRSFERNMDPHYIRRLAEEYEHYFAIGERQKHFAPHTRVLHVNTNHLDLVSHAEDKAWLLEQIQANLTAIRQERSA